MEALKMERPMDNWNDDRLDELNRRVDEGFKETREGFARVDREMKEGFARVDRRFEETATRENFAEVNARLDRLEGRVENRFDRLESRFDKLGGRIDRFYYTFLVVIVALSGNMIVNGG